MEQRTHSGQGEMAAYHRAYYKNVRRPGILTYVGGPDPRCAMCGTRERLETDHVDPDQKSFNIARNMTVNNPLVQAELDKCQLLCGDCHLEKTRAEREAKGFTHGSWYGWLNMKCQCGLCTAARDAYNAERREERQAAGAAPRAPRPTHPPVCGERRMYRKGCRCEKCKAANAARQRAYQDRKKARA